MDRGIQVLTAEEVVESVEISKPQDAKKYGISDLFAISAAVICGVGAVAATFLVLPIASLVPASQIFAGVGFALSNIVALISRHDGGSSGYPAKRYGRTVVIGTAVGATGLVGLAGAAGAFFGYGAGAALGYCIETTRGLFTRPSANKSTLTNG